MFCFSIVVTKGNNVIRQSAYSSSWPFDGFPPNGLLVEYLSGNSSFARRLELFCKYIYRGELVRLDSSIPIIRVPPL